MKKLINFWNKTENNVYTGRVVVYFSIIFLICFMITGCSFLPRFTFDTPNTVPQSVDKSKAKEVCKGKAEWDDLGNIKSCSKGYYRYDEGYTKQERRMTIVERIKSFINNLAGWGFWGFVVLLILCPSLLGLIAGRIIEGTVGLAKKTLDSTIRAVQKARKQNVDLNVALSSELDTENKKYIAKIKEQEKIK